MSVFDELVITDVAKDFRVVFLSTLRSSFVNIRPGVKLRE
jgi:hypothetical protein